MTLSTELWGLSYFLIATTIYLVAVGFVGKRSTFFANLAKKRELSKQFFLPLNGLRGILTLTVMVHHAGLLYELEKSGSWYGPDIYLTFSRFLSDVGTPSLRIFFLLSGFLFWQKALTSSEPVKGFSFWLARFRRLAPAYAVIVLIDIVVTVLKHPPGTNPTPMTAAAHIGQWIFFNRSIPHLHDTSCYFYSAGTLIGPAWSLLHESVFYMLLPFLTLLKSRVKSILLIACVFTIAASINYYRFIDPNSPDRFIASFLQYLGFSFGSGMLAAWLFQFLKNPALISFFKRAGWLSVLCLFASPYFQFSFPLQSVIIFIGVLPIALGNSLFGILSSRAAQVTGEISYSVYLFHSAFFIFALKLTGVTVSMPVTTIGIGLIVLAFSMCVFRWIEFPAMAMRWNLFAKKIDSKKTLYPGTPDQLVSG